MSVLERAKEGRKKLDDASFRVIITIVVVVVVVEQRKKKLNLDHTSKKKN